MGRGTLFMPQHLGVCGFSLHLFANIHLKCATICRMDCANVLYVLDFLNVLFMSLYDGINIAIALFGQ